MMDDEKPTCSTCEYESKTDLVVAGLGSCWSLCFRDGALGEFKDGRPMPWPRTKGSCSFYKPRGSLRRCGITKKEAIARYASAPHDSQGESLWYLLGTLDQKPCSLTRVEANAALQAAHNTDEDYWWGNKIIDRLIAYFEEKNEVES